MTDASRPPTPLRRVIDALTPGGEVESDRVMPLALMGFLEPGIRARAHSSLVTAVIDETVAATDKGLPV